MVILVASCDKNDDIFYAFYHCMEKYWENHPEIIYATETIKNPYYKTINYNYPLDKWTVRMRKTLQDIDDDKILLMIDDCFIRTYVDEARIKYVEENLKDNIANFNFEKSWDANDEISSYKGFKKRMKGSSYEVSMLCGMWQKSALISILARDCDPWTIETEQESGPYDYYTNSSAPIIDWGYETWLPAGIYKGKWCKEIVPFFEKEGITVDYEKRGFAYQYYNTLF